MAIIDAFEVNRKKNETKNFATNVEQQIKCLVKGKEFH